MKALKQILVLLVLAAWLPAMNHCSLGIAGFLPADDCCAAEESAETKIPSSEHACEDGCEEVEGAGYKSEDGKIKSIIPLLAVIFKTTQPDKNFVPDPLPCLFAFSQTLFLPQFDVQTALPIRAPDFAS